MGLSTGIASVPMGSTRGASRRHVKACGGTCESSLELSADAPTAAGEETRTSTSPERAVSRRPPQTILTPVPPGPAQALKQASV